MIPNSCKRAASHLASSTNVESLSQPRVLVLPLKRGPRRRRNPPKHEHEGEGEAASTSPSGVPKHLWKPFIWEEKVQVPLLTRALQEHVAEMQHGPGRTLPTDSHLPRDTTPASARPTDSLVSSSGNGPDTKMEKRRKDSRGGPLLEHVRQFLVASRIDEPAPYVPSVSQMSMENWNAENWKDELQPDEKPSVRRNATGGKGRWKGPERGRPPHIVFAKYEKDGILIPLEEPVLQDVQPTYESPPIAELSHGLDRVLFNPGVHWVQDPRSRVYNFTPWLENIPKVSEFDYNRVPGFKPSSRDRELRTLAKQEKKRFTGSTSSLSGVLSQCYFLISEAKDVDTSVLSSFFRNRSTTFSPASRWPASVILNYKDGIYSVDSDKSAADYPDKTILTWLGVLLERFLTLPSEAFTKLLKVSPLAPELEDARDTPEAYRYSKSKHFLMRSQLDCYDSRLPGTGVFDLKTRACVPTRLDVLNYEEHTGYIIKKQYGLVESFEKEYYDLIRSAFLKYSFQVRIGNMDGVLVAYHNTERLFGFQYVPLSEMDERLFGPEEGVGDRVFEKCVGLMEEIMKAVVDCHGEQSVKATFETKEDTSGMHVWVEPLEWDGPEDERPIEQLRVEVTNYLGEDPVRSLRAAASEEGQWTVRYRIQRLDLSPETMRSNRDVSLAKQGRPFLIPSHVTPEMLEEYWSTLSHSGELNADAAEFDPSLFVEAPASIQKLREVSRKGREEVARLLEMQEGQPKIVLGGQIN